MKLLKPKLYSLILVLILAVVVTALGGGVFNQQLVWVEQWQHRLFRGLCHQIPDRSFWINGQPMAVCSRCAGIYGGFAIGWVFLGIVLYVKKRMAIPFKRIILLTIGINLLDFVGNMLGLWENTLASRFGLGLSIGLSAALLFAENKS